jgi:hypothetical protein
MKIDYKKLEPIVALIVLICVVVSCVYLIKYVNNQEEIKENCGWEQNETYYCYCDHDFVTQKQIQFNESNGETGLWD